MSRVIDITIVYPDGVENIWEFMCSKNADQGRIEILPIEGALLADSSGSEN